MVRQVKYRVKQNELLLALGDWTGTHSRLKKRLDGHGGKALVCTFHSLGYRILRSENEAAGGRTYGRPTGFLRFTRFG